MSAGAIINGRAICTVIVPGNTRRYVHGSADFYEVGRIIFCPRPVRFFMPDSAANKSDATSLSALPVARLAAALIISPFLLSITV